TRAIQFSACLPATLSEGFLTLAEGSSSGEWPAAPGTAAPVVTGCSAFQNNLIGHVGWGA
ncbi:MAG: hypothetical protein QGF81_01050, partial [Dehalococcoidia bacterium]|nr:hypothetical protein [Dehalococcoidia bacterium]